MTEKRVHPASWLDTRGGYRYIAGADQNQIWATMTYPRASGYALVPALIYDYTYGLPYNGVVHDKSGEHAYPFYVPAVVRWESAIGVDGKILPDVMEELIAYDIINLPGPPVRVSDSRFLCEFVNQFSAYDDMAFRNFIYPHEICDCGMNHEPSNWQTGIASAFQLTPITNEAYFSIHDDIKKADHEMGFAALALSEQTTWEWWDELTDRASIGETVDEAFRPCHCRYIEEEVEKTCRCVAYDCPEAGQPHEHTQTSSLLKLECQDSGTCPCAEGLFNNRCVCGSTEPTYQQLNTEIKAAVEHGLITVEGNVLRQENHEIWRYCINSFMNGLKAVHDLQGHPSFSKETTCFTSSWQQLSPYSDMRSLEMHRQKLWQPSIDLVKPLAS